MHRLVGCKLECRCWRARGKDVSFTDVKIRIPGPEDVNDVMRRKRARRIWGDLRKVSWVESYGPKKKGWLSLARRGLVAGATRVGGAGRKASIERLCLSPYIEKPFNSKVIKSFVPELRSRKCFFFVFRDSYILSIYVMNILCMAMLHV